jgi:hypothetical protein
MLQRSNAELKATMSAQLNLLSAELDSTPLRSVSLALLVSSRVLHTLALRGSSERVDAMEEALEAARAEITGLSVLCVSRRLLTTAADLNEDNGVLQAACARMERESMEV